MFSTKRTALAAGVCAMGFLAPASASAQSLEMDHYSYTESYFVDYCGDVVDFPVLDTTTYTGFFHSVRRGDGFAYDFNHVRLYGTDTNTLNGKSLTFIQTNNGMDQAIVDNGDGTLTLTFKNVGMLRVYGPDGELLFKRAGQFRGSVLLDDNGTPTDRSDDEFIAFLGFTKTPHLDTSAYHDFCTDLAVYLS